eukprot:3690279-Karenia_brevis.AAC.1
MTNGTEKAFRLVNGKVLCDFNGKPLMTPGPKIKIEKDAEPSSAKKMKLNETDNDQNDGDNAENMIPAQALTQLTQALNSCLVACQGRPLVDHGGRAMMKPTTQLKHELAPSDAESRQERVDKMVNGLCEQAAAEATAAEESGEQEPMAG